MFLIFIETIILSVVQGITEFLPVSSSAHLIIFSKLGNFQADSLTIDIGVHLGSLIAILIFFRKDLLKFSQNKSIYKSPCQSINTTPNKIIYTDLKKYYKEYLMNLFIKNF